MSEKDKKEPERHVHKPIVQGKEIEKTRLQKAVGVFFSEDLDSIKGSIVDDYIRPRARDFVTDTIRKTKEMIVDNITSAAEIIFFGDSKKKNKTGEYNGQKVNYVSYYTGDAYDGNTYYYSNDESPVKRPEKPANVLRRVYIPSYRKAEEVLTELLSLSKRYPAVSVADYYQLVSVPTTKADFSIGWFDLVGVDIAHTRDGYIINLPKPVSLG